MTNSSTFAKIARIATGSLGLGAAVVLLFMGAPADAAMAARGVAI